MVFETMSFRSSHECINLSFQFNCFHEICNKVLELENSVSGHLSVSQPNKSKRQEFITFAQCVPHHTEQEIGFQITLEI